jgi:hypothetical protein
MATTLKTKNSVTTTVAPTSLAQGELAVNITDKKMWVGNAATTPVQIVGAGATNRAGGSNTQVQYNSSGDLAGSANMTFSGTALTLANDASISGLTVGKGGGAVSGNVIVNTSAMASNTTGSNLVAVGDRALNANTTGNGNSAFGYLSLYANTTGSNNTGYGGTSLIGNTTGSYNTAVGYDSLRSNTTASNNTAVGYQAGYSNTTGSIDVVGRQALYSNTTGDYNAAFGLNSLYSNTTGVSNVAVGRVSLNANTTGGYNVAIGHSALQSNTTASNNTAVGYQAGYSNTTGARNAFGGFVSGYSNTTGTRNTGFGPYSLYTNSTGNYNVAVGDIALYSTTGSYNTAIGIGSGELITTGSKNTIIGAYNGNQGGLDIRTKGNYIVLSDGDGNPRIIVDDGGQFLFGTTSELTWTTTVGFIVRPTGSTTITRSNGQPLFVNRLTNDGILVDLMQDGTSEGNISVSGTTVSFNGGHLSRWSQLPDGSKNDAILKGTVLSNLDDMCVWEKDGVVAENEQLNKMKVSDVEGDTNVAGVFVNWTVDEKYGVDDMNVAMTGDMIIRIADGVVVQKGDLLMSAGDGTAKPQGDDIRRSKTVAKVTSNHVTCTYADGSYCVPCVLMAC